MNDNGERVACPKCGHNFEVKEYPPLWSFSEEGIKAQKAINAVKLWSKINSTVVGILGVIIIFFFILVDNQSFTASWFIWILSYIIRISGIYYLCVLENKLLRKLMIRKYPQAFNL